MTLARSPRGRVCPHRSFAIAVVPATAQASDRVRPDSLLPLMDVLPIVAAVAVYVGARVLLGPAWTAGWRQRLDASMDRPVARLAASLRGASPSNRMADVVTGFRALGLAQWEGSHHPQPDGGAGLSRGPAQVWTFVDERGRRMLASFRTTAKPVAGTDDATMLVWLVAEGGP